MATVRYTVAPQVFEANPGYCRGVVVVRDARNDGDGAAVEAALRQEEDGLRQQLSATEVATYPPIAAWRDAYRR